MVRPQQLLTLPYQFGALCLFGILGGCTTNDLRNIPIAPQPETPQEPVEQASGVKKVYSLNDTFGIQDEVTDVVITFTKKRKHKGEEFLKPEEGHYWFYVTGTVKNKSTDEFVISPDFYTLSDDKKKTYTPSERSHALNGVKVLQGRIPANSERTAEIGFELPNGTKPVLLSFDISNFTACNDTALQPTFFCQPISINLAKGGATNQKSPLQKLKRRLNN